MKTSENPRQSEPNKPKILLVEDDDGCREFLSEVIKLNFPEASFNFAANGFEALGLLKEHAVDLVLTDILHPGPSGFEILRFLRSSQPTLPVIVTAGFPDGSGEFKYAKSLGATAYLSKLDSNLSKSLPSTIGMLLKKGWAGHLPSVIRESTPMATLRFGVAHLGQEVPANFEKKREAIQSNLGKEVPFFMDCGSLLVAIEAAAGPVTILSSYPEDEVFPLGNWETFTETANYSEADRRNSRNERSPGRCHTNSARFFFSWLVARYPQIHLHLYTGLSASDLPDTAIPAHNRIKLHRLNRWGDYLGELANLAKTCQHQSSQPALAPAIKLPPTSVARMNEKPKPDQPAPAAEKPDLERVERELKQQLTQGDKDPQQTLWQLAQLYKTTGRPEQALECFRRVLAGLSDLEKKAACVLALGQTMEQLKDFPGAINFYREALSMQPARNDTWYFIHNNLGYSYNQIGEFANGEKFCRAAIQINPSRPNAHKNLGLALAGQGQYSDAAHCYIAATYNQSGDARSLHLLKELIQEHPEMEFDFQNQISRCERMVAFAATAIQRFRAGHPFRVLLGINGPEWVNMYGYILQAMTGGAVQIKVTDNLKSFVGTVRDEEVDLGFLAPENLLAEPSDGDPWENSFSAIRHIRGIRNTAVVLVGTALDRERSELPGRAAGAAEFLELSNQTDALVDTIIQLLTKT